MAWRRKDDKPLFEPMLTRFTDTQAALGGDKLMHERRYSSALAMKLRFSCIKQSKYISILAVKNNVPIKICTRERPIPYLVLLGCCCHVYITHGYILPLVRRHVTVNPLRSGDTLWRHRSESTLTQVLACSWRHQATKPLPQLTLIY